jgi:hypothetical protein
MLRALMLLLVVVGSVWLLSMLVRRLLRTAGPADAGTDAPSLGGLLRDR